MDKILVHGGRRLSGSTKVSGSKNSSLPILAATLLTREPCVVHGVPDLSDTNYMLQILAHLGAQVERASGTVTVTAEKIHSVAPYDVVRKMRASVCVLGPLLGRCKEASVALPGGCVIGDRPIDLHLKGFEALGSAVRVEGGDIKVFAPKLRAAQIDMKGKFGPTVLGTDNVMMAAVLADGVTPWISQAIPFPSCPTAKPAPWKSLRNRILVSPPTCRRKCARYFRRTEERVQLPKTFFRSVICTSLS